MRTRRGPALESGGVSAEVSFSALSLQPLGRPLPTFSAHRARHFRKQTVSQHENGSPTDRSEIRQSRACSLCHSGAVDAIEGPNYDVHLRMSRAEALVLFEWVHRHEDETVTLDALVADDAERQALWAISGALESLLVEPFRDDYATLVEAARESLRSPSE